MSIIVVQPGRRELRVLKRRKTVEALLPAARVAHDSRNTHPSRTQTHFCDPRLSGGRGSHIIAVSTQYHISRSMSSPGVITHRRFFCQSIDRQSKLTTNKGEQVPWFIATSYHPELPLSSPVLSKPTRPRQPSQVPGSKSLSNGPPQTPVKQTTAA